MKKSKKSKIVVYVIILGILIAGGLYLKYQKNNISTPFKDDIAQTVETINSISISSKEIKEKNFSGKVAIVSGENALVKKAQTYIDQTFTEFKKRADTEVPDIRKEFGADSPSAQYELVIEATYIKSEKTESVSMLTYEYTGGAHGNNSYNVISASKINGEILTLADLIKTEKKESFTNLVKRGLIDWRPYKTTDTVVFTEEVENLNFNSFVNWSLDDKNLILYFSQYEIGPGVLGPVAFPLPIEKIKDFLK